ncbi:MAG: hypothetical protein H6719_17225 [Sandaracinaceae bacterium]|nr:hypothetical protein [Sandaracinaceae bacterium]
MTRDEATRLAHDVGKYVARIARNAPAEGPFPAALVPMLVKDLYALPGGKRASERFVELAPDEVAMAPLHAALTEIDALEERVRAGDDEACRRACVRALEVEAALRAYAREAR